jgi:hypothetical protein
MKYGEDAAQLAAHTLLEAVPEAGVPNGHLYAVVMGHLTMVEYKAVINLLKKLHAVEEKNHYLTRGDRYDYVMRVLEGGK